jgi:hypothetical protein
MLDRVDLLDMSRAGRSTSTEPERFVWRVRSAKVRAVTCAHVQARDTAFVRARVR